MTKILAAALLLAVACGGSQSSLESSGGPQSSSEVDEPLLDYDPSKLVKFSLLASTATVAKDERLTLGAQFEIADGWHIYWLNPGDSGLPTKIKLEPTEGLAIDAPSFPGPVRFDSAGDIINYGYRGTLLVPMDATVSSEGASFTVNASASWLACREDACVPGKGSASITLGDGANLAKVNPDTLNAAVTSLPQPLEAISTLGGKHATSPGFGESELKIDLPAGHTLELFPRIEKLVQEFSQNRDGSGEHYRWRLNAPNEEDSLAILSVNDGRSTHFYSITTATLQTLNQ